MNCDHALKHPFLPLFPNDNIAGVSFSITQTFKTVNSQALFNHTDFEYAVDYVSRIGEADERTYSVRSNAVLYAYDYDAAFFLPLFDFNDNDIGDYQKINAMPYNDFFWEFNDEYRLNDSLNTNETFFLDSASVTNKSVFKSNPYIKKGLMEFPFVAWSPSRIKFREMVPDTSVMQTANSIPSQQYKLSVKIFADMNSYSDSTNFLTATIFDRSARGWKFSLLRRDSSIFCSSELNCFGVHTLIFTSMSPFP